LCGLFLVRNWCGSPAIELGLRALCSVGDNVRTQVSLGDRRQANSVRHRAGCSARPVKVSVPVRAMSVSSKQGSWESKPGEKDREFFRASKDRSIL
jgi:hypothetical protein